MDQLASTADDPRSPDFPPEVPDPLRPGPARPIGPIGPVTPPSVPLVPMPGMFPPGVGFDDPRSRLYDDLLKRRTILLDRALDDPTAMLVAAQLIALDGDGPDPITLVVNSPGGPLEAAVAVLDTLDTT